VAALAKPWQRRLGIEPGEERVLAAAGLPCSWSKWATVSVTNVAETFFLKRIGVARLPIVFLVNSILLAGTSVAAGRIVARTDPRRLLVRACSCCSPGARAALAAGLGTGVERVPRPCCGRERDRRDLDWCGCRSPSTWCSSIDG
jgi:hypothetical protein